MRVLVRFHLVFILATLLACERNTDTALHGACDADDLGVFEPECARLASLRLAMISTNDELRRKGERELVEDFRSTIAYAASTRAPRVVCKQSIGGIFCLRTEELFVHYGAEAARQIAEEIANAVAMHQNMSSEFGIIFCQTGGTETFDLANLDATSFTMHAADQPGSRLPAAVRSQFAARLTTRTTLEVETLETLASDACGGSAGSAPGGSLPIPASQTAFNACMVNASTTDPFEPLNTALELAADVSACLDAILSGPTAPDDPLAQARENLENLMDVAGSTAGSSSAKWDEYGNAKFTAENEDGEWQMSVSTTGQYIVYDPDGTDVIHGDLEGDPGQATPDAGPFAGVVVDDEGVTVTHQDDSQTSLSYEGDVKKSHEDDEIEEPKLEPLPPPEPEPEEGRCAPDDPACTCGAKADLAQTALTACIVGGSACGSIANTFACCEEAYDMNPLVQPAPDGQFVCEGSAAGASEQVQYCAEQCSVFEWDGCMEWCLNGRAELLAHAGWLDNVCLYVAGLECTYIPTPAVPDGETPSGPRPDGLPQIPENILELPAMGELFGNPDHALLEEMILRQ